MAKPRHNVHSTKLALLAILLFGLVLCIYYMVAATDSANVRSIRRFEHSGTSITSRGFQDRGWVVDGAALWTPPAQFGPALGPGEWKERPPRPPFIDPLDIAPLKRTWVGTSNVSEVVFDIGATCSSPGRSDVAVIFVHIYKAGGTSIRSILGTWCDARHFGSSFAWLFSFSGYLLFTNFSTLNVLRTGILGYFRSSGCVLEYFLGGTGLMCDNYPVQCGAECPSPLFVPRPCDVMRRWMLSRDVLSVNTIYRNPSSSSLAHAREKARSQLVTFV